MVVVMLTKMLTPCCILVILAVIVMLCTTLHVLADSSSQALDTLSTVLGDCLQNLTKVMRVNADQALENGGTAFADVLDQSLHQIGVRGKRGLDKYWQDSVQGFVRYLQEEISETTHEYQRLTVSDYVRLQ